MMLYLAPGKENHPDADSAYLDSCLRDLGEHRAQALTGLYEATSSAVYGFALTILRDVQDAEDVLHDCYLSVCSAAAEYRSSSKPMAWILTIVRNLCLKKLREREKRSDLPQEDWERWLEGHEGVSPEDRLVLAECMTRLTEEERQIVVLHAVAGFRHREIAQVLELPLPTVLSKYHRALKKLRDLLTGGEAQ